MRQNTEIRPFSALPRIPAPESVRVGIRARIDRRERRRATFSLGAFVSLAIAFASLLAGAVVSVAQSLALSGADQFASLAVSDWSAAFAFPRELGLALLESLPAFGVAIILVALLGLAWSVSRLRSASHSRVGMASLA